MAVELFHDDGSTTVLHILSLHDALPICGIQAVASGVTATLSAGPATLGVTNGSLSLLFNNDGSKVLEASSAENTTDPQSRCATACHVPVKRNTTANDYSAIDH